MASDVWHWSGEWTDEPSPPPSPPPLPAPDAPPDERHRPAPPPSAPPSIAAPAPDAASAPVTPVRRVGGAKRPRDDAEEGSDDASSAAAERVRSALERNESPSDEAVAHLHQAGVGALRALWPVVAGHDDRLATLAERYLQLGGPPEAQSFHGALAFIQALLLPRFLALAAPAPRPLLQLLLAIAKRFPRQTAEALVAPALQSAPPPVQTEVLLRLAREALPPALLATALTSALSADAPWSDERAPDAVSRLLTVLPAPAPEPLLEALLAKSETASPPLHPSHRLAHLLLLLAKLHIDTSQPSLLLRLSALLARSTSYVARSAEQILQGKRTNV